MGFVFWKVLKHRPELAKLIENKLGFNKIVSRVLSARFDSFERLCSDMSICELESPFSMLNMEIAVNRLKEAVAVGEKIAIYGDYDCDGVCASAILFSYLKRLNANVLCHIPQRSEGYGLNIESINLLKNEGVSLVVTVDNGITAIEEARLIANLNMDLIITDHHNVANELPKAIAILNPKQPGDSSKFKEICGAVVVLKLIASMEGGDFEFAFNFAGDLAAIATVADLVPLVAENRLVVLKGLCQLKNSKNLGLIKLLKLVFAGGINEINSIDLAFKVCPIINAAGRIKSANLAFDLLVCDETEQVEKIAAELVQTNFLRKQMQQDLLKKAFEFIEHNVGCLSLPVLVVYGENWSSGLIGLVAGGLLQKFKKPVVVLSINNEIAVGSARSFESFKIFEALNYCSSLFLKWGGHDFAGGLTLKTSEIQSFIFKINEFAKNKLFAFVYKIDAVVDLNCVNFNFVRMLQEMGPFGKANEQPVFLFRNLKLLKVIPLKQGAHLRLEFEQAGFRTSFLAFNVAIGEFPFEVGCEFNVIAQIDIDKFLGVEKLCFRLVDMRPKQFQQQKLLESFKLLRKLELTNKASEILQLKPERADYEYIYLNLKQKGVFKGGFFQFFCLHSAKLSCFKVYVVLRVFVELGLAEFNGFELKLKSDATRKTKVKIESSKLLKKWFSES